VLRATLNLNRFSGFRFRAEHHKPLKRFTQDPFQSTSLKRSVNEKKRGA
jgi:hypothetical protein